MYNFEFNKELLKENTRYLNNIFNFYLVCYFALAACYGANKIFQYAHNEYFFASILVVLWLIMKPIILFDFDGVIADSLQSQLSTFNST